MRTMVVKRLYPLLAGSVYQPGRLNVFCNPGSEETGKEMALEKFMKIPLHYQPEIGDLPGELPRIARVVEENYPGIGVSVTLLLAQAFGGQEVYFHMVTHIEHAVRDDIIRSRYDQDVPVKTLAVENWLSTRQIRRILNSSD